MSYGVTALGFVKKTFADLRAEMISSIRGSLGNDIDLSDESPDGQILNIMALARAEDWDVMEDIYYSQYPNTAAGVSLDNASRLTNSTRKQPVHSLTVIRFTGLAGSVIPLGTVCETATGIKAVTTAAGEIGALDTYADVPAKAVLSGAVSALAGSLTVLPSPIVGITAASNTIDLTGGSALETDAAFRLRRLEELQRPGTASIEGMRNQISALPFISKALVIENAGSTVDIDGRPAKSVQVIVETNLPDGITHGSNAAYKLELAEEIFNAKAAGIETFGVISDTVIDSQGFSHTVNFSEPTPVAITIVATIEENTNTGEGALFPADGVAQVKDQILLYGESLGLGQDVWYNKVLSAISAVNGVKGISSLTINGAATTLTIAGTEASSWDSSTITVTVT